MGLGTEPLKTDTRLMVWKRILQRVRNENALSAGGINGSKQTDTVRVTLKKIINSLKGK